jgi:uncharacterized SAM-binding protein YcdF (DUF218 family)
MYFLAAKTIGFFIAPSNFILTLAICGLFLWRTRFYKIGIRVTVASILFLLFAGIFPVGTALLIPLEGRFQPWDATSGPPTGIIVLGGVIDPEVSMLRKTISLSSHVERLIAAIELYRRYPNVRVVFTGGSANFIFHGPPESEFAARFLEEFGIPRDRIELESDSRTTGENAVNTMRLLKPKPGERWVLITSAWHMPRAIGLFRKAGVPVEAYPVDWHTVGWGALATQTLSVSDRLGELDLAAHEWAGLIFDWLAGRTSTFLPGP